MAKLREELESLLWNPQDQTRGQDEWKSLLAYLLASLVDLVGVEFEVLDLVMTDNAASLTIRQPLIQSGNLHASYAGGLSITLRHGVPGVYVILFPFLLKERVLATNGLNHVILRYQRTTNNEGSWSSPQWLEDVYGEYDGYTFQWYYRDNWPFPKLST